MGGPGPPLMPPGPLGSCCILMSLGGYQKKEKNHTNTQRSLAIIGATHIITDMKSRFMDSLIYRKQPKTLIIKSSIQAFILEKYQILIGCSFSNAMSHFFPCSNNTKSNSLYLLLEVTLRDHYGFLSFITAIKHFKDQIKRRERELMNSLHFH